MRPYRRLTPLLALLLIALGAVPAAHAAPDTGTGQGSVTAAYIRGATPGAGVELLDANERIVGRGSVDRLGSFLVRDLRPGDGYRFRVEGVRGNSFRVLDGTAPPQSQYDEQRLQPGMNYVRMRDGITLAAFVRLPFGKTLADGPFPTVVEYSGYQTAAPNPLVLGAATGLLKARDPLAPANGLVLGAELAPDIGFASVSVQMRGSGCSGGAYDLFDYPTVYDGYDIVETVAAQPWVAGHKVGLVGISYSGISQIAVAGTEPPSLAAIAPMSLTEDLHSTGFPGGIFNTGFADTWLTERQADATPGPDGGQPYVRQLIQRGDQECAANQSLRLQTPSLRQLVADNPERNPEVFDHRSPSTWAPKVRVPVLLTGALQDEQVGPQWTRIIDRFDANPDVWVRMINGAHFDSLGPQILSQWWEFLNIFVAERVPPPSPALEALSTVMYAAITRSPAVRVDSTRLAGSPSVSAAKAAFANSPRVEVFYDNGAGAAGAGGLAAPWSLGLDGWPSSRIVPTTWHLGAGGALSTEPGAVESISFRPDPAARPAGTLDVVGPSDIPWQPIPPYNWTPLPGDAGIGFTSPVLDHDVVTAGPASLDLQLSSTAPVTDLQATVTEVRPDGRETYVASGYLRSSYRAVDANATELQPIRSYRNPADLSPGFNGARISIDPMAHAFRAGSRIRVTLTAPGGDRTSWRFDTPATNGLVVDTIQLGAGGSALVLPVISGAVAGAPLPACDGLRGQPCRAYAPAFNGG
ncbi:CocE/NonD family hydrolase [Nocardia sp. NPDC005978]|uniref:CocE/NonD family hydrolase n=1 Tax=Nocardia sp. NPDC005978 TaxID=3156725 RepID=UPI0033A85BA5